MSMYILYIYYYPARNVKNSKNYTVLEYRCISN